MPSSAGLTILLTGANGQLGQELMRSLKSCGRLVAAIRPGSVPPAGCESQHVDLASPNRIRELVRSVRPGLIVNAAAYTAVDAAENDRDIAMAVNGIAPGILAEEAARLRATLIHFSTDYVFSGAGTQPWREDDLPGPINFYGQSKLAGEEAIRRTGAAHWIPRISWLYGIGGRNFVTNMLQLATERTDVSVVDDQIGAPTSTRFVAEITTELVARASRDRRIIEASGETLHVACAGETSWHGLAMTIFALASELRLGIPIPTLRAISSASYASAAKRPLNSRLDLSRLCEQIALIPPRWDDELRARLPGLHARRGLEMRS